jgi:hypothetical protein
MSTPASSGPTVTPRLNSTWRNAFADGSSSTGSSRGITACRAGCSMANSAACAAITTYSSAVEPSSPSAWATRTSASSSCPEVDSSTSLRRSKASAIAPP